MRTVILTLERVSLGYAAGLGNCRASSLVLRDFSLDVYEGDVIGVAGPPGCGKSTLLLCAAGLLRPLSGSAHWFAGGQPTTPALVASYAFGGAPAPRPPDQASRLHVWDDALRGQSGIPLARLIGRIEQLRARGDGFLVSARDEASLELLGARIISLRATVRRTAPLRRVAEGDAAALGRSP
jgi:energy-coupling factor transporter ATP-binding protein EcfA2